MVICHLQLTKSLHIVHGLIYSVYLNRIRYLEKFVGSQTKKARDIDTIVTVLKVISISYITHIIVVV